MYTKIGRRWIVYKRSDVEKRRIEWRRVVYEDRTEKDCIQGEEGEGLYTRIGRGRIVYKDRNEKDCIQG